jgi:hypothetical protein
MVLVIAALLLQATPFIQPVAPETPSVSTPSRSAASAPAAAIPIDWAAPSRKFDNVTMLVNPSADNTATVRMNMDSVNLENSDSKTKSTYSLNAVSLDATQNAKAFETIRIPEPNAAKRADITTVESYPSRKAWLALSIASHSAAIFDAYSTRVAVSRGAVEDDPLMRPFAHSPAIYGAIQVGPVLLDLLSRRMQHSQNEFVRRMWWVPLSVSTSTSIFAGVHNLGVARRSN